MKKMPNKIATTLALIALYGFLYVPLINIAINSFNAARYSSQWQAWTWQWYLQMTDDPALLSAAWHSFIIATVAAAISTTLGALFAFVMHHYRARGHRSARKLLLLMMLTPDIVLAIGLLIAYHLLQWPLGFFSVCLGHIALCLPLATLLNIQQCQSIDPGISAAAKDLGANDWVLLTRIVLPLLKPNLLVSFLLCFVISFDDTILSYFLTGPNFETLPVYLFGQIKLGVTPILHAISTSVLCLSVIVILCAKPATRTTIHAS